MEKLATHTPGFKTQPYTALTTLPFFLRMDREGGLFHTNPFRGYPDREGMMEIIRDTVLPDKPYPFGFSNSGIGILGYIVGLVSGEGFWDILDRYIREELGLEHTFLGNVDMVGYDREENPCRCWQWEKEEVVAPAGPQPAASARRKNFLIFCFLGLTFGEGCAIITLAG